MGLLDDFQVSAEETKRRSEGFATFMRGFLAENPTSPEIADRFERFLGGETLGTALGLETAHRDAIVAQGLQYLRVGRLDDAHDWLSFALAAEPLDERALYGLGVVAQLRGDLKTAAHCFVQFQALDATNPEGLLRLGECLYANREFAGAAECWTAVVGLCGAGHG
jgi:tetratricopeptide (TPR) repeat protein